VIYYRNFIQPHVEKNIHYPLKKREFNILCIDTKQELGVDLVVDIENKVDTSLQNFKNQFNLGLCCNLLEHVVDLHFVLNRILDTIDNGGYCLLTVPYKYYRHMDPIDTMYRPSPNALLKDIQKCCPVSIIDSEIITINNRADYYTPVYPNKLLHNLPFWGFNRMWQWVIKPMRFKITALLIQKTSPEKLNQINV